MTDEEIFTCINTDIFNGENKEINQQEHKNVTMQEAKKTMGLLDKAENKQLLGTRRQLSFEIWQ